jgi:hypothetical protein
MLEAGYSYDTLDTVRGNVLNLGQKKYEEIVAKLREPKLPSGRLISNAEFDKLDELFRQQRSIVKAAGNRRAVCEKKCERAQTIRVIPEMENPKNRLAIRAFVNLAEGNLRANKAESRDIGSFSAQLRELLNGRVEDSIEKIIGR